MQLQRHLRWIGNLKKKLANLSFILFSTTLCKNGFGLPFCTKSNSCLLQRKWRAAVPDGSQTFVLTAASEQYCLRLITLIKQTQTTQTQTLSCFTLASLRMFLKLITLKKTPQRAFWLIESLVKSQPQLSDVLETKNWLFCNQRPITSACQWRQRR